MNKKMFIISEEQKKQIFKSIEIYINNIQSPDIKKLYKEKINDDSFKNLLIYSFAEISFLSQSLITSIKMLFDFKIIHNSVLDNSKNDIFEVQELKMYILNQLSSDLISKKQVDNSLSNEQFKEYKKKISIFKKEYINLFE